MSPSTQDSIKTIVRNAVQQAMNTPGFMRAFTHHKAQVHPTFPSAGVTYLRVKQGRTVRTFRVVVSEVMNKEE